MNRLPEYLLAGTLALTTAIAVTGAHKPAFSVSAAGVAGYGLYMIWKPKTENEEKTANPDVPMVTKDEYEILENRYALLHTDYKKLEANFHNCDREWRVMNAKLSELQTTAQTELQRRNTALAIAKAKEEELKETELKHTHHLNHVLTLAGIALEQVKEETKTAYEEVLSEYDQQLEAIPVQYTAQIEAGKAENRSLRAEVDRLHHILMGYAQPKKLEGSSRAVHNANRLVDWFLTHDVAVDAIRAKSTEAFDEIWVKPRMGGIAILQGFTKEIWLDFALKDEPTVSVDDGAVKVRIQVEHQKAKPITFIEPVKDWFKNACVQFRSELNAVHPQHMRITGESESGKSTTVNNIIATVKENCPGIVIKLGDPMATSNAPVYSIPATWEGDEDTVEGLNEMAEEAQLRKDNPNRPRPLTLVIIDEIDTLAADYKTAVTEPLKKIWKQGRHVGMYLIIIGQSPNVSLLKLQRADVANAVQLHLGQNIPTAIELTGITPSTKTQWLAQFEGRRKEGQKYLTFVVPKTDSPYLAPSLPPLGKTSEPKSGSESQVLALAGKGMTVAQIVESVYGLKPSRSAEYKRVKDEVMKLLSNG